MLNWAYQSASRGLRRVAAAPCGALAGLAFMLLATMAIKYDEAIAPGVSVLSNALAAFERSAFGPFRV